MRTVVLVGAGIIAGLMLSIGVNRWLVRDSLAAPATRGTVPGRASTETELRALERQVQRLGARVDSLPKDSEPTSAENDEASEPDEAEEAHPERLPEPTDVTADVSVREHEKLEVFAAQPVDSSWAASARSDFVRELGDFGKKLGATVESVDCRTRDCKATLRWPSYAKSAESYRKLLSSQFTRNCGHFVHLAAPDDPSAEYVHDVIFHCR